FPHSGSEITYRIFCPGYKEHWQIFRYLFHAFFRQCPHTAEHLAVTAYRKQETAEWICFVPCHISLICGKPFPSGLSRFKFFVITSKRHAVHQPAPVMASTESADQAAQNLSCQKQRVRLIPGPHDNGSVKFTSIFLDILPQ